TARARRACCSSRWTRRRPTAWAFRRTSSPRPWRRPVSSVRCPSIVSARTLRASSTAVSPSTMFKPEEIGPENSNEKFNALQQAMTMNPWDGRLTRELQFVKNLRERFPQADVRDVSPIVWDMRKYKAPAEIAILRDTARVGVEGHKALIRSTRPGVTEHALSAVFDFVTALNGARGLAYYTIIMSGKNHAYGHYHAYDRTLADGDFLILDAGPAYRNYHVDISTTFPASGRFTPRQRELYEAALVVRNAAIDAYRPG